MIKNKLSRLFTKDTIDDYNNKVIRDTYLKVVDDCILELIKSSEYTDDEVPDSTSEILDVEIEDRIVFKLHLSYDNHDKIFLEYYKDFGYLTITSNKKLNNIFLKYKNDFFKLNKFLSKLFKTEVLLLNKDYRNYVASLNAKVNSRYKVSCEKEMKIRLDCLSDMMKDSQELDKSYKILENFMEYQYKELMKEGSVLFIK